MCIVNSSIFKCWCLAKDSDGCYELCAILTVLFVNVGAQPKIANDVLNYVQCGQLNLQMFVLKRQRMMF